MPLLKCPVPDIAHEIPSDPEVFCTLLRMKCHLIPKCPVPDIGMKCHLIPKCLVPDIGMKCHLIPKCPVPDIVHEMPSDPEVSCT